MRVLVTRPQPQAEATRAALEAAGHSVLVAPVLVVEPDPAAPVDPAGVGAVAFTSRSAVAALAAHPQVSAFVGLPAFAVGAATAGAARKAGFAAVESADGAVEDLARLILSRAGTLRGTVLHVAGAERAGDLAALLAAGGVGARTAVLYRTRMAEHLPEAVAAALGAGGVDAVLLYSPRSAAAFARALARDCPEAGAAVFRILALSPATLAAFTAVHGSFDAGRLAVAARPDERSLLALLEA